MLRMKLLVVLAVLCLVFLSDVGEARRGRARRKARRARIRKNLGRAARSVGRAARKVGRAAGNAVQNCRYNNACRSAVYAGVGYLAGQKRANQLRKVEQAADMADRMRYGYAHGDYLDYDDVDVDDIDVAAAAAEDALPLVDGDDDLVYDDNDDMEQQPQADGDDDQVDDEPVEQAEEGEEEQPADDDEEEEEEQPVDADDDDDEQTQQVADDDQSQADDQDLMQQPADDDDVEQDFYDDDYFYDEPVQVPPTPAAPQWNNSYSLTIIAAALFLSVCSVSSCILCVMQQTENNKLKALLLGKGVDYERIALTQIQ